MPTTHLDVIVALLNAGFTGTAYKPLRGREGPGSEYKLLYKGKPAAIVTNWGDGAETEALFINEFAEPVLRATVEAIPPLHRPYGDIPMTQELALDLLADALYAKRSMKKKTVFFVNGDYMTLNAAFTPDVAEWARTKYPSAVILNDHPAFK
jgi:hypothetical protein